MAEGGQSPRGVEERVEINLHFEPTGPMGQILGSDESRWNIISYFIVYGTYFSHLRPEQWGLMRYVYSLYINLLDESCPECHARFLAAVENLPEAFRELLRGGVVEDVRSVFEEVIYLNSEQAPYVDFDDYLSELVRISNEPVQLIITRPEGVETYWGDWCDIESNYARVVDPVIRIMSMPAEQSWATSNVVNDDRAVARRRSGTGVGQERPGPLETRGGRGESSMGIRRPVVEARVTERRLGLDAVTTASRTFVQSGLRASAGVVDGERIQLRQNENRSTESSNVRSEHENSPCERHSHMQAPCGCCLGHGIPARPPDCSACGSGSQSQKEQSKADSCRDKLRKQWLSKRQKDAADDVSSKQNSSLTRTPPPPPGEPLGELDVDELVRRIEGTSISGTSDPKKAAKKARQKEKKLQMKIEEDRQRELEEKLKRQEEERLEREKLEREAEELRLAEEQKRLARKAKKKNKKQRAAAAAAAASSSTSIDNDVETTSKNNDVGFLSKINSNGTVTLTLNPKLKLGGESAITKHPSETARSSVSEPPMTGMVTIRRCSSKENLVTITSATSGGKKENLLYYLLDGQLYSYDSKKQNANDLTCQSTPTCVEETDVKKKKKKNNKPGKVQELPKENFVTITATQTFGGRHQSPIESSLASFRQNGHSSSKSVSEEIVDIDKIRLPPGITITKVESGPSDGGKSTNSRTETDKSSNRKPQSSVISSPPNQTPKNNENGVMTNTVRKADSDDSMLHYIPSDDLDLFGPKETEEFEEVVSYKTRKNRQRAAKVKERGNTTIVTVSEDTDSVRSSPSRSSLSSRYTPPFSDRSAENGVKRCVTTKSLSGQKYVKPLKSNARSCNTGNITGGGFPKSANLDERLNVIGTNKREPVNFQKPSENYMRSSNAMKVMPRLSRPETTNGDFNKSASSTKENYDPYNHQFINLSQTIARQQYTSGPSNDSERYKALLESNPDSWTKQPQRTESETYSVGTNSNHPILRLERTSRTHGNVHDFSQPCFKGNSHLCAVNTATQQQVLKPEGCLQNTATSRLPNISKETDQSWSPWDERGVWSNPGTSPSPRYDIFGLEEPISDRKTMNNLFCQKVNIPIQRPTPSSSADISVDSYVASDETLSAALVGKSNESQLSTTQYFGQSSNPVNTITNGMDELRFERFDSSVLMKAVMQSNGGSLSNPLQRSSTISENVFNGLDKQVSDKVFSTHRRHPWDFEGSNGESKNDRTCLPEWHYQSKNWGPSSYSRGNVSQPKQQVGNRYGGNRTGIAPQVLQKDNHEWFNYHQSKSSPNMELTTDTSFRSQQQRVDVNQSQFNNQVTTGLPLFQSGVHTQWSQRQGQTGQNMQTPFFQGQGAPDSAEICNADFSYWQEVNNRLQCPEVSVQLVNNASVYGRVLGSNPDYSGGARH